MARALFAFIGSLVVLFFSFVAFATPVQWASNGHYYELVPSGDTWTAAKPAAETATYLGLQGHLATITSAAENLFITNNVSDGHDYWLGGYQPDKSKEPAGGWTWVTGEAFSFTNWNPGEPNNTTDIEDYLEIWGSRNDNGYTWNDDKNDGITWGYIVEYEAVPLPASLLFLGPGLVGLGAIRRRSKVSMP